MHVISDEFSGQTILGWLRHQFPDHSWSRCRKMLGSRRVFVNGVVTIQDGRRLAPGDQVEIRDTAQRAPTADDVPIRYLDRDLVVIEKPPGIVSTRRPEELHWPLAQRLLAPAADELAAWAILQRESKHPGGHRGTLPRLWRVQRLDRDTSGLLVFTRREEVARDLIPQFAEHRVRRIYLALVQGVPQPGTIRSQLLRDAADGRRRSAAGSEQGQTAITHLLDVQPFGKFSLVRCRLETGRTHQIRIHLAEQGHPVCGETRYLPPPAGALPPDADAAGARTVEIGSVPRLALHACELGFVHPRTGAELQFEAPLPRDLSVWMQQQSNL